VEVDTPETLTEAAPPVYTPCIVIDMRVMVDEHGLLPGRGPVRVHWAPDELWPQLLGERDGRAPKAAILLDLLADDEPRARREAARALRSWAGSTLPLPNALTEGARPEV